MRYLAFAVGAKAGSRVAEQFRFTAASPTTLLRLVRKSASQRPTTPRILGVDDFALRKGDKYGTILCDLEQSRPIELLLGRDTATLANWLQTHPGVQVISRDRASGYAEGAKLEAPAAIQVADRWHLLYNLSQALKNLAGRQTTLLHQLLQKEKAEQPRPITPIILPQTLPSQSGRKKLELLPRAKRKPPRAAKPAKVSPQRTQRLEWYNQVKALQKLNYPNRQIASELHLDIHTVRKYVKAAEFPERRQQPRPWLGSKLDIYQDYLVQRWQAGVCNGKQLWREVTEQGYVGVCGTVYGYIKRRPDLFPLASNPAQTVKPKILSITPWQLSSWLFLEPAKLSEKERTRLDWLKQQSEELNQAYLLVQKFRQMLTERKGAELEQWLACVEASTIPELVSYARGIRRDQAAVTAGLSLKWSNGPVEGQVNRLKFIKRSMYGRANFDLLRARVLWAA